MLSFITTSDILLSHIYAIERDHILHDEKILMEQGCSSCKQDKLDDSILLPVIV